MLVRDTVRTVIRASGSIALAEPMQNRPSAHSVRLRSFERNVSAFLDRAKHLAVPLIAFTSFLAAICSLAGCAAAPGGPVRNEEFVFEERALPFDYQTAYRNLRDGFQKCGAQYRVADADLEANANVARFDVYLKAANGGRADYMFGVISVKQVDADSSVMLVGVQTSYDNEVFGLRGNIRRKWFALANGDYISCGSS